MSAHREATVLQDLLCQRAAKKGVVGGHAGDARCGGMQRYIRGGRGEAFVCSGKIHASVLMNSGFGIAKQKLASIPIWQRFDFIGLRLQDFWVHSWR